MMKLVDGPAKGTYMCKRAPLYLRAVVNDKGGTDALDMPSDAPTDLEAIHVYRRIGGHSMVHLNMADRRMSGFYVRAEYGWLPDVDGEYVRETVTWQRWVEEAEAGRILARAEPGSPLTNAIGPVGADAWQRLLGKADGTVELRGKIEPLAGLEDACTCDTEGPLSPLYASDCPVHR